MNATTARKLTGAIYGGFVSRASTQNSRGSYSPPAGIAVGGPKPHGKGLDGRLTAIIASGVMPPDTTIDLYQQGFGSGDSFLLPDQLTPARWRPEQSLLQELLDNAITDARTHEEPGMSRQRAFRRFVDQRRALCWIFSPGMGLFSFEWVCEHINMDAVWLRKTLRAEIARAPEIEDYLLDPENVEMPEIPREFVRQAKSGRKELL